MAKPHLSIRELQIDDISLIADYWLLSDPNYMKSMGVDLAKLPLRDDFTRMLTNQLKLPIEVRNAYCLIWELDEKAIGHSNTNPTIFGKEAFFHTHIWKAENRKTGYGADLLRMSIATYFNKLSLKKLIGEPFAHNPAPNRLLEKLGFKFIRKYKTTPGSLNFEQEVNRWELIAPPLF